MIISGNHIQNIDLPEDYTVVSLVPSLTELLYFLGLNGHITGITRFCELPREKVPLPKIIGGTKNPSIERIRQLKPSLIIASKEENLEADVGLLSFDCMVWVTDIKNLEDNISVLNSFLRIFGKSEAFKDLPAAIGDGFSAPEDAGKALYLIWQNPFMTVGGDTFISDMLGRAGFQNITRDRLRYPEIDIEEIRMLEPEWILLSSEPYPFREKHVADLALLFPDAKVVLVDGQMFSWYGVRPLYAPAYFEALRSRLMAF